MEASVAAKNSSKKNIRNSEPIKSEKEARSKIVPEKKKADSKEAIKKSKEVKKSAKTEEWSDLQLDPIADPNGYVRQNYSYLSNKQLASLTGFSEHTIRRKLGEWGLKRAGKN